LGQLHPLSPKAHGLLPPSLHLKLGDGPEGGIGLVASRFESVERAENLVFSAGNYWHRRPCSQVSDVETPMQPLWFQKNEEPPDSSDFCVDCCADNKFSKA
jgi:hypothetical protein